MHATPTDTTYNVNDTNKAWLDLYTWTIDMRALETCRQSRVTPSLPMSDSHGNEEL